MQLVKRIYRKLPQIEKCLSSENIQFLINYDYTHLYNLHFGIGLYIKNLLRKDKRLMSKIASYENITLDDISALTIEMLYFYLKDKHL